MTVTVPTAPFDLGNGQHGVIVEAEPTFGEPCPDRCHYVLTPKAHPPAGVRRHNVHDDVRCRERCMNAPDGSRRLVTDWGRPQWVLDALEPCGMCDGTGRWFDMPIRPGGLEVERDDCAECSDGKPVVEFQVPCPGSRTACPPFSRAMCRFGGEPHPAGRWTVTEALPILGPHDGEKTTGAERAGFVRIHSDGSAIHHYPDGSRWTWDDITLPGDPADLIGKHLVIVEAEDSKEEEG